MKINYPIKYAAMPIIEQVGWTPGLHELNKDYDTVCYIVSKCYLISDSKIYQEDGHTIHKYEVVFPYQRDSYDKWKREIPTFNVIHGRCSNSTIVTDVFDNYADAVSFVNSKNDELCKNAWSIIPYSDNFLQKVKEVKENFDFKLQKYKVLESQIALSTESILNEKCKILDDVIKIENKKGKIIPCNIYQVINLYDNCRFVAYSVSIEQYKYLTYLVGKEQIQDVRSLVGPAQALLINQKADGVVKLALDTHNGACYIKDNALNFDTELSSVTSEMFDKIDDDMTIFYTTETIDDILGSYQKHTYFDTIDPLILKREKK